MRYAEHAPGVARASVVRCVWVCEDAAPSGAAQPVVGDGCPELLVHFGAPMFERGDDGRESLQPRALVAGQLTRPLWLRPSGNVGVIGVRFHPWAAHRVIRTALCDLTDRRVALDSLMDGAPALVEAIMACSDDPARVTVVEAFVARRLEQGDTGDDPLLEQCVARLAAARAGPGDDEGAVSIDALAREMNVNRRLLERRFAERVGVSPRALASILRLRRFFDQLDHAGAPLLDAALAAGYYDQSHFAREFRRYAGLTATEFLATRPALASAIFDL
jgi:AraC-like DNA-binding protein